ncbi:MAG: DNA polymerase III subunit gamma/tau C-terminal domain-containing protein, partial [Casimicrobiaceae bacterium]
GRADLALAPDEQTGFAMTLLRLLAFEPGAGPPGDQRPIERAARPHASTGTPAASPQPVLPPADKTEARPPPAPLPMIADWPAFVAGLKLSGIALQLAAQTELKAVAGNEIVLAVAEHSRHLTEKAYADKLKAALDDAFGRRVRLRFDFGGDPAGATLAAQEKRERAETRAKTEAAFRDDPFVQDVLSRFDARIKSESIKPNS